MGPERKRQVRASQQDKPHPGGRGFNIDCSRNSCRGLGSAACYWTGGPVSPAEALLASFRQVERSFPSPLPIYSFLRFRAGAPRMEQMFQCRVAAVALHILVVHHLPAGPCSCAHGARAAEAASLVVGRGTAKREHRGTAGILCSSLWFHTAGERSAWWARRGCETPAAFCWLESSPHPAPLQQSD